MNTSSTHRRYSLQRLGIAAVLAGLLAGGGALASEGSRGHGPFGLHAFHGELTPERIERLSRHLAVEVDASPEQTEKLRAILQSTADEVKPVRAQMRQNRNEGMALFGAASIDRDAIESLRAQQMELAETLSRRLTTALAEMAEVLTPEQRQKLIRRMERAGPHHRRG